jgi:hypothetical protein
MNLRPIQPPAQEFVKTLAAFGLLPDLWIKHPVLVAGAMKASKFWAMDDRRGRTIGLVWLNSIIEGESAGIHILVNKDVRNYMRAPKLDREKMMHRKTHDSIGKLAAFWFILDYAFEDLGVHILYTMIPSKRLNALRLMQRMGFRVEGTLRDRMSIGGERDNVVMASILRPEYEAMRQAELPAYQEA